ncbi:glycosyltransferase family 2 protein [Beijerinckia sp. L45]|uniref:glycosyltransferase family 2 protein n=1 Tax=Beijerinckia sp. L45 TaxID=1641855 RepID=UPI00131E7278|nr:glycosyltransferase family 2 protein [Beijerinckia sp. L45]
MRYLAPTETERLEQASPVVWTSTGDDPGFIFHISPGQTRFIGFFLSTARGEIAPKIAFDQGSGFNDMTALSLKAFPFAFYHIALDKMREVERLRFRPATGEATFRFLPFQTDNAILVAILHYLFNLRYQKIGLVSPDAKGHVGFIPWITSNVARTIKFFRDVSSGGGLRVQEGSKELLPNLKYFLSLEANAVQSKMDTALVGHAGKPLISFVSPTYNTNALYLADLLKSFAAEKAAYAELILSDDGSTDRAALDRLKTAQKDEGVRVLFSTKNAGIAAATNAGIQAAQGEWIAFIDHDDQFVSGAIAIIAKAILDHPDADFFYTDEIITDVALRPVGSFCKPAFDSVLLSGMNYINHFSVFRRARLKALGGLRTDREGSQDYDLLLRYLIGAKRGSVIHIPFLAYMWRREEKSYSSVHIERSVTNARLALKDAYKAAGVRVDVVPALDANLHRIKFSEPASPKVSVIIPNKNSFDLISRVIDDLRRRTDYSDLDIVIVDNGTTDADVLAFYGALKDQEGITIDIVSESFNFAGMCNRGARLAKGDALLFLNNDVEVKEPFWLIEMVSCLAFDSVGIVGAKLLYPNGLNQHNGVIVGLGEAAGHWYIGEPADEAGPMGRFNVRQSLTAVTGACMLVTRRCFETLGGFDQDAFPIAYNDVDFCLRAKAAGFRTIWTPFAQLIHHESVSRGSDEIGANNERFKVETARLRARHGTATYIDDAYSPYYDRRYSKPHLALPTTLPSLRPNRFS